VIFFSERIERGITVVDVDLAEEDVLDVVHQEGVQRAMVPGNQERRHIANLVK
jgi:hypothetical protein